VTAGNEIALIEYQFPGDFPSKSLSYKKCSCILQQLAERSQCLELLNEFCE
jgi:hypothetical protein